MNQQLSDKLKEMEKIFVSQMQKEVEETRRGTTQGAQASSVPLPASPALSAQGSGKGKSTRTKKRRDSSDLDSAVDSGVGGGRVELLGRLCVLAKKAGIPYSNPLALTDNITKFADTLTDRYGG